MLKKNKIIEGRSVSRRSRVSHFWQGKFLLSCYFWKKHVFFIIFIFFFDPEKVGNHKSMARAARRFRRPPCAQVYANSNLNFEKRKNRKPSYRSGFRDFGGPNKSLFGPPSAWRNEMGVNAKEGKKWSRARRAQKSVSDTLCNFFFFVRKSSLSRCFCCLFFFSLAKLPCTL